MSSHIHCNRSLYKCHSVDIALEHYTNGIIDNVLEHYKNVIPYRQRSRSLCKFHLIDIVLEHYTNVLDFVIVLDLNIR